MISVVTLCFIFFPSAASAYDPLEGFFEQSLVPCFEVIENPVCDTSIPAKFTAKSALAGPNEPITLVYLFTPTNKDKAEQLHLCGGELPPDTTYNKEYDTEVFIHGWLDGVCRTGWMREMKEQLFLRGNYQVILVDWTWGNTPNYDQAGLNSRTVGEQVGFVINNIMRQTGSGPEKFHVIGHSFGAIASGFVGRSVNGLRRITGLDPALAPFKYAPPSERLTYRDAKIVDIIHSNAAECFYAGIGDPRKLGHADFYPNGGSFQPSCYPYLLTSLLKLDLFYGVTSLEPRICSHLASIQFYKVTINPKGCEFVGIASQSYDQFQNRAPTSRLCRNHWAVMGMDYEKYRLKDDKKRRRYYLNTRDVCPYYDNSYLGGKQFKFNTSCSSQISDFSI